MSTTRSSPGLSAASVDSRRHRGGPLRRAPGLGRPRHHQDVAAPGHAHPAGPPGDLHHRPGAVLRRPGAAGADPRPLEPRHRQLGAAPHRAAALLRVVDPRPGPGRRAGGVRVAPVPLPDRLRDRIRPAHPDLRAPDADVVPVLRPRPVRSAHLACQLRHPVGADVHDLRADDPRAVQHRAGRLRLHALDRRAPRLRGHGRPCPSCSSSGTACARSMFPVSWLIQARLADVATIVDENVNGVRVVRSFAQEKEQLRTLAKAADKVQWGYVKDADLRARWTPAVQNLPQVGLALVLGFGGYMVIHGTPRPGCDPGLQLLSPHAPGAVHDAGHDHHDGPARRGVGRAHLRDPRRGAHHRRPPRRGRPRRLQGRRPLREGGVLLRARAPHGPRPTSTCTCARARPWPWWGGRARASRPWPGSSPASTTSPRARFLVDGHDVRDLTIESLRANVGVVLDDAFLFSVSIRDNIAYGRPDADIADVEAAARAAGADEFIRGAARGLRHRGGRARLHACRAANASASPSPGPCSSTRPSWSSTTPPAPSTCRWSSRSTTRCACSWRAAPR